MKKIKLYLVDDHRMVIDMWASLLSSNPKFEIVGTSLDGEKAFEETVRYRTVGDASCTGAVRSTASNVDEVLVEVAAARITERGATRADDNFSDSAMEDRKREGYF